jgi:DNA-binding Lrp family transcriptional regulator
MCLDGRIITANQSPSKKQYSKLDAIDINLLRLLQEDCRLSFNQTAKKIQISVGTAYNRTKHLQSEGYIKGCTILTDTAKLGYPLTAVIFIQAEGAHLQEVEKHVAEIKNSIIVYDITGEYDAMLVGKFKDREDLNNFIKHLAATRYVKRTITNVSLNTVKEDFRLLPEK